MGVPPFGQDNSIDLALAAQVDLELGKDPGHVEERLANSCRGVHGLFSCGEMGPLSLSIASE